MITDETSSVSLMGDFLVVTHMGAVGGVDLQTRQIRQLHGRRDTYGGLFGPGAAKESWDGSKQLAARRLRAEHGQRVARAGPLDRGDRWGRMFWVVGGCVVCFGGPDVPAGPSAGNDPPEPMKWQKMPRIDGGNLTGSFGAYDANLKNECSASRKSGSIWTRRKSRRRPTTRWPAGFATGSMRP